MIHALAFEVHEFVARRVWPNLNAPKASIELCLHVGLANPHGHAGVSQIRTFTPLAAAWRN